MKHFSWIGPTAFVAMTLIGAVVVPHFEAEDAPRIEFAPAE